MLVNLARGAVFDQETAEDSEAAHPEHLAIQQCIDVSHLVFDVFKITFGHLNALPHPTAPSRYDRIPYLGILASLVPFLFPNPLCLPIRRAAVNSLARARECMVTCLRMMRPSDTSLRIVWRELAFEISFISLGSSQILRLPQPTTEAARRFWVRRLTL